VSDANDIPARVAVLEQIAKDTRDILVEMRADMRETRAEMRGLRADMTQGFNNIRGEVRGDIQGLRTEMQAMRSSGQVAFFWLLGLMLTFDAALLGVMAHGFGWI